MIGGAVYCVAMTQASMSLDDTSPFFAFQAQAHPALVFLCDHAGRDIPAAFGRLGLPDSVFEQHIAYDIGAGALTRSLAAAFQAPALLGRFSRLFIDLNRGIDDPTLVMKLSDGQIVPGNAHVTGHDIAQRITLAHQPYHQAISDQIDRALAMGVRPVLVSIHSFTPHWRGRTRPWHVAVLSSPRDRRLADLLLAALARVPDLCVGDNEPYTGDLKNDTLSVHGLDRGLAHVLIEVRQDLIGDQAGVTAMTQLLVPLLRQSVQDLSAIMEAQAMDQRHDLEAEAAAFRRLVGHLRARTDVQNIDLMRLAGFCRNCLGDWLAEESIRLGRPLDKAQGREAIYGMPYAEWKAKYQVAASAEQLSEFAKTRSEHK